MKLQNGYDVEADQAPTDAQWASLMARLASARAEEAITSTIYDRVCDGSAEYTAANVRDQLAYDLRWEVLWEAMLTPAPHHEALMFKADFWAPFGEGWSDRLSCEGWPVFLADLEFFAASKPRSRLALDGYLAGREKRLAEIHMKAAQTAAEDAIEDGALAEAVAS